MQRANPTSNIHPAFAGVLSAISGDAVRLAAYVQALKRHDWTYNWSDDHRAWRAGSASFASLRVAQRAIDVDFAIWNEHCPAGHENGVAA